MEIRVDVTRRRGRASGQRAGGQSPTGWETRPGLLAAGRAAPRDCEPDLMSRGPATCPGRPATATCKW